MSITMIGLDIAKSVFQVHAMDAARQVEPGASCSEASCFRSSESRSPAPLPWRRVARRTTNPSYSWRNYAGTWVTP